MAGLGRGSADAGTLLRPLMLLVVVLCCCVDDASAVTHTVGGSKGWDLSVDYASWAKGQTFKVGDVLFFPYDKAEHDVVVVDKSGYETCSAAKAISTLNDGNDNVTLSAAGTHYYLCSVIGHCSGGMKLAVTVSAGGASSTAAPVPAPAPTAPFPPAPSSSAPVGAPASAPSPALPVSPAASPLGSPPLSPEALPASPPPSTITGPPPPPSSNPNAASSSLLASAALVMPPLALLASLFSL